VRKPEPEREETDFALAKREGSSAALKAFMARYPSSSHLDEARCLASPGRAARVIMKSKEALGAEIHIVLAETNGVAAMIVYIWETFYEPRGAGYGWWGDSPFREYDWAGGYEKPIEIPACGTYLYYRSFWVQKLDSPELRKLQGDLTFYIKDALGQRHVLKATVSLGG